jgi:hypothetical protein
VSKATKKAKHEARNAPKVRRGAHRRGRTPNPAFNMAGALDDAFDWALFALLKQSGIRDALKNIVMGGGSVTVDIDPEAAKCVCGGACLCHGTAGLAAVPCPPGCPSIGHVFDGCHRCYCQSPAPQAGQGVV